MAATSRRFPPHPIRDVHARYTRQTSEPAYYAVVTVDFEPRGEPAEGLELEIPDGLHVGGIGGHEGIALRYLHALTDGIARELAEDQHQFCTAARIVLRQIRFHPVDSSEAAFHAAGRLAARAAVERVTGTPAVPSSAPSD